MPNTLRIQKEFPYDRINSFRNGNPYIIKFIYPSEGKPFIVKGGSRDVDKYINENVSVPAIINVTWWHHGKHRSMWRGHLINISVRKPVLCPDKNWKYSQFGYEIMAAKSNTFKYELIKKVRKMPRCWLKELNGFI